MSLSQASTEISPSSLFGSAFCGLACSGMDNAEEGLSPSFSLTAGSVPLVPGLSSVDLKYIQGS